MYAPNFVISSKDFQYLLCKTCDRLEKFEISERTRRTGALLSKQKPLLKTGELEHMRRRFHIAMDIAYEI